MSTPSMPTMPEDDRPMFCPRCDEAVPVVRPWPYWRYALYVWYGMMGLLVLLFPVMASDYCVMIPTMMMITLAGSPLHRLAAEKPVCRVCSLEIDPARRDGTGVRPRARTGSKPAAGA